MGKHNCGREHKRLADINALFRKLGIWFKATAIQPTIGDGSCGYHAFRRYFDAIPGHPYANLTIGEWRSLAARLMRADVAAQEQAVAVEDHNVNEICRQILGKYGYWGWLDGLIISLLSAATCTNIVVVHCKG